MDLNFIRKKGHYLKKNFPHLVFLDPHEQMSDTTFNG